MVYLALSFLVLLTKANVMITWKYYNISPKTSEASQHIVNVSYILFCRYMYQLSEELVLKRQQIVNEKYWERAFRYGKNHFYVPDPTWLKYAIIIQNVCSLLWELLEVTVCIQRRILWKCKEHYIGWPANQFKTETSLKNTKHRK